MNIYRKLSFFKRYSQIIDNYNYKWLRQNMATTTGSYYKTQKRNKASIILWPFDILSAENEKKHNRHYRKN